MAAHLVIAIVPINFLYLWEQHSEISGFWMVTRPTTPVIHFPYVHHSFNSVAVDIWTLLHYGNNQMPAVKEGRTSHQWEGRNRLVSATVSLKLFFPHMLKLTNSHTENVTVVFSQFFRHIFIWKPFFFSNSILAIPTNLSTNFPRSKLLVQSYSPHPPHVVLTSLVLVAAPSWANFKLVHWIIF